jgi:oxalate oxidoreductase subunit delta
VIKAIYVEQRWWRMSVGDMKSVRVHARGVTQTSAATQLVRLIAEAAVMEGKDSVAWGYYNDSPDRINVPVKWYAGVSSKPIVVSPPYEPPVVEASVILEPALLKAWTTGEGVGGVDVMEGLSSNGVLAVNTESKLAELRCFLPKSGFTGRVVTLAASRLDRSLYVPMAAVVAHATGIVSVKQLGDLVGKSLGEDKRLVVDRACREASVEEV